MRDVDALLVVAHEASPSGHPAEGALDDPAKGSKELPLASAELVRQLKRQQGDDWARWR